MDWRGYQSQLNLESDSNWITYKDHRSLLTTVVLDAIQRSTLSRSSVAVLGAGNCNDLDLLPIMESANKLVLVDLDGAAMERGLARQGMDSPVRFSAENRCRSSVERQPRRHGRCCSFCVRTDPTLGRSRAYAVIELRRNQYGHAGGAQRSSGNVESVRGAGGSLHLGHGYRVQPDVSRIASHNANSAASRGADALPCSGQLLHRYEPVRYQRPSRPHGRRINAGQRTVDMANGKRRSSNLLCELAALAVGGSGSLTASMALVLTAISGGLLTGGHWLQDERLLVVRCGRQSMIRKCGPGSLDGNARPEFHETLCF